MMNTYYPFAVPFFITSIENWPEKKNEFLSLPDWDDKECMNSRQWTDFDQYKNSDPPYRDKFLELISKSVMELGQSLGVPAVGVGPIWAQRYWRGHYMNPHTHGPRGYSAILYAELNDDHPCTEFLSPFKDFYGGNDLVYNPEVKEGDVIFFPSSLYHHAPPHDSDNHRTIFSFNMMIKQ